MLFDSCYAANMVTGRWQPNANVALVEWARKLLADVEATGSTVHWVHIKGHSSDGGNDRADDLVQWGKASGPYCRRREGGGEGVSQHGAATVAAPTIAKAIAKASESGAAGGAARQRRGDVLVRHGLGQSDAS
eukprot:SAG11_NODE_290_length_11190_cov_12.004872_4_plen_133_part_00